MHQELLHIAEGMVGPALLMVFGACAKYLRDISKELGNLKETIGITNERIKGHGEKLENHDERIRELETAQTRGYVS